MDEAAGLTWLPATAGRRVPLAVVADKQVADEPPPDPQPDEPAAPAAWERTVASGLAFLRRRLAGDYEIDDFGFDPDLTENVAVPALRPLYRNWFRTEVLGIDNLPETGAALLVANHAGGLWALDAAMLALCVHDEHPARRFLRLLGADLIFTTPVL